MCRSSAQLIAPISCVTIDMLCGGTKVVKSTLCQDRMIYFFRETCFAWNVNHTNLPHARATRPFVNDNFASCQTHVQRLCDDGQVSSVARKKIRI